MKELIFLGTGSSTGVPVIGCDCRVCHSDDVRDNRTRVSLYLKGERTHILFDASPDLRMQAIKHDVRHVDALFLTHAHNDHVAGIDELRIFNFIQKKSIPVYGDRDTLNDVKIRFGYIFDGVQKGGGIPHLDLNILEDYGEVQIGEFKISSVRVQHGSNRINGYIIDDHLAFVTDCNGIPEKTMEILKKRDSVIMDAVRIKRHPTHYTFDQARDALREIRPNVSYFIHMNHDYSHSDLERIYGEEVVIPYDGMRIRLP